MCLNTERMFTLKNKKRINMAFCMDLFSSDQLYSRRNNSMKFGYFLMSVRVLSPKSINCR